MEASLAARISRLKEDFHVSFAESHEELAELQRLRFDVFCLQRGILAGDNGTESDPYDSTSRHVVLRRPDGEMVGTVRLVLPVRDRLDQCFPMQRVCDPTVLSQMPLQTTGEISRFCLSRNRRDSAEHADAVLRLGLMKGILQASIEAGLTHWCAVMEKGLLRLLRLAAIWFEPMGPQIEYFGTRQPAVASIADVLARGQHERRPIWDYVTNPDLEPRMVAVAAALRPDGRLDQSGRQLAEELPSGASAAIRLVEDLLIFNPTTFERTTGFLTPQLMTTHLQSLADCSEALLRTLSAIGAPAVEREAVAALSHTLAGSAGLFGYERLAAMAGRFGSASGLDAAETTALVGSLMSTITVSLQKMRSDLALPGANVLTQLAER